MSRRGLLVVCPLLLLLGLSLFFNPLQFVQMKEPPKDESLAHLEKISERLDKSDEFIKELKAEKDKVEAASKAEEVKKLEERKIAEAKKKADEAKAQIERERQKVEEAKRLEAEAEAKKVAEKKAADDLLKAMKADLLKTKRELDSLKVEFAVLKKKPTEVAPTLPIQPPKEKPPLEEKKSEFIPKYPPPEKKKLGPPVITESRSFDKEIVPKQPPNPKTSSVRLENETDEIAKVKINDTLVDVKARKIKFVTVPAGQFTYQVLGVHEKPILSELNEGQIYGLAIRNAPKGVKDKIDKVKQEEPKPPLPMPPLEEEIPQKTVGGGVRLINNNSMTIPFSVNGKTYRVEPGQEILVKVPVGRCTVGFTGMTSQVWSYDVVEGTTLRLGCSFSQAPSHGYYYPMQGYYPRCGFRYVFRIMTAKDGDKRVVWDCRDLDQIADAKTMFDDCIEQGLVPYRVDFNGKVTSEVMDEFDPDAEEVIFLPVSKKLGLVTGG